MQVSIIIPSYYSEKSIDKVLAAAFAQETSLLYEVILVDSTPGNAIDLIAEKYKKLIFLKQKNKTTASAARNIGAKNANGLLLLFVDSDVTLDNFVVSRSWENYSKGAKIFSGSLSLDQTFGFDIMSFIEFSFYFSESFALNPNKLRKNLPSTLLAIEKEVFEKLGTFTEYGRIEDTILTEYAIRQGYQLFFYPEIKAKFFQEVSLVQFLNKCKFNGINLPYARFGRKLSIFLRATLFFLIPFIAISKLILMTYRNIFYRESFMDKIIFIAIYPIIIMGIIYWAYGGYITILLNQGVDQRR